MKRARASDVKSITPIPPKIMGNVAMFHKVLTFDLVSFPPHIKLQTIFLIWVHMVIGLQQDAIYQLDVNRRCNSSPGPSLL
jgi:hypothetical protein